MKSSRKLSVNNAMYRYAYAEYLMHLGVPVSQVTSALGVDSVRLSEVNRNQQFIDIMKKTFKKKPYETMALRELALEGSGSLLGGSIVTENTIIESAGQEIGAVYDFSQESTIDGGHIFNQDWEAGTDPFPAN